MKAKEPSLPYYLPITGGRIDGKMSLIQNEPQTTLYSIWTLIADFISNVNNRYTKHASPVITLNKVDKQTFTSEVVKVFLWSPEDTQTSFFLIEYHVLSF